jgi:hypothetical protein
MARSGKRTRLSVSTDTKITALFVVLGLVVWYGSRFVVESRLLRFALLIGVGVIVPTLLTELRA